MTITLLAPDGVPVTAKQERQARAAMHGGGSGRRLGGRSGFRVDTPNNVLSATSTTWTLGPCAAMIDPGWVAHQGMYGWSTDANITGAIAPAHDTYDRKDVLFIQVNDDTAGDGSGLVNADVVYLEGNASSNPTAPYADGFLVGTISVPKLGGGNPTVTLNTARYAAAAAPLPVFSQAEMEELPDKYNGLTVQRLDLPGRPYMAYDGSKWHGQVWTPYTPIWGGWVNLGGGYVSTGSYMMVAPNLCAVRMKLKAGSASPNLGTASLAVTLPFKSAPDQSTWGEAQWLGTGVGGGLQRLALSNPPNNDQAALVTMTSGAGTPQTPGAAGFGYGAQTEVHATLLYRTA